MKIAIHHAKNSYSKHWIEYCELNELPYKLVNCYGSDIINQMDDCDALMWHFHHTNPKDHLFAKQLLYSIESSGKIVFPDFKTVWHFDDKVGQKYLLESIKAPLVPSYVFYEKKEALNWINAKSFPIVFKLRGGSGSSHVMLVKNRKHAKKLVKKAFGKGFSQYQAINNLKERWRKYYSGKTGFSDVLKGIARIFYTTNFNKIAGKEKGYIYFQDFIPNNNYDIRINIIEGKCFAQRRGVRPGDFRASGSGILDYDIKEIPKDAIRIAFDTAKKLSLQSVAFDFIMHQEKPLIVEMSCYFGIDPEDFDYGYWNSKLEFIEGKFNPFGWMIDGLLGRLNQK